MLYQLGGAHVNGVERTQEVCKGLYNYKTSYKYQFEVVISISFKKHCFASKPDSAVLRIF